MCDFRFATFSLPLGMLRPSTLPEPPNTPKGVLRGYGSVEEKGSSAKLEANSEACFAMLRPERATRSGVFVGTPPAWLFFGRLRGTLTGIFILM